MAVDYTGPALPFNIREQTNTPIKQVIARKGSSLVNYGEAIFIDGGTME